MIKEENTYYWSRRPDNFINCDTGQSFDPEGTASFLREPPKDPPSTSCSQWSQDTLIPLVIDISEKNHKDAEGIKNLKKYIICGPDMIGIIKESDRYTSLSAREVKKVPPYLVEVGILDFDIEVFEGSTVVISPEEILIGVKFDKKVYSMMQEHLALDCTSKIVCGDMWYRGPRMS